MNDRDNLKYKILSQQWFMLLLIILLISVLTVLKNPRLLMLSNVMDIFEQIAVLGLMVAGATILAVLGNFDISVEAITGLSSCLVVMMMDAGIPIPAAVAVGILAAMFCTFFDGVFTIPFKTPSFIISPAATNVYTGTALCLTKEVIRTVCGKFDTMNWLCLSEATPLIFIISLVGCVVVGIILQYTQMGRRILAIGSSKKAASLSGVKVTRNELIFFVSDGFFVGLAAVLLLSKVDSALPSTGAGYGPQAMGAVIIGGVPANGGKGNIVGTFFGILLIGLISNVLNILGANSCLQKIASGVLTIISLGISAIRVHILIKNQGGS